VRTLLHRLDPLVWLIFGGGFMAGAFLLPAWIAVVGIAVPLGWVPAEALSFERMTALAAHPVGRLVLLAAVVLPLWNFAFHFRHTLVDLFGAAGDTGRAWLLYAVAGAGTVWALVAVIRL